MSVDPEFMPDADGDDDLPDPEGMPDAGPFEGGVDGSDAPPDAPTTGGTMDAVRDALNATEPDTPLSEISDPWNPEEGGKRRVYRGIQKMTGNDGMPAWYDLVIGAVEVAVSEFDETGGSQ